MTSNTKCLRCGKEVKKYPIPIHKIGWIYECDCE